MPTGQQTTQCPPLDFSTVPSKLGPKKPITASDACSVNLYSKSHEIHSHIILPQESAGCTSLSADWSDG
jgi:hypothetical protein